MSVRSRIRRLERETEGEKTTLMCPECGAEFVAYGDVAAEFIAYEWARTCRFLDTHELCNRSRYLDAWDGWSIVGLCPVWTGAMQDVVSELRRILILRGWVHRGAKKDRDCYAPAVALLGLVRGG